MMVSTRDLLLVWAGRCASGFGTQTAQHPITVHIFEEPRPPRPLAGILPPPPLFPLGFFDPALSRLSLVPRAPIHRVDDAAPHPLARFFIAWKFKGDVGFNLLGSSSLLGVIQNVNSRRRRLFHEDARIVGAVDREERLGRFQYVEDPPLDASFGSVRDLRPQHGLLTLDEPRLGCDFRLHSGYKLPDETAVIALVNFTTITRPHLPHTSSEHFYLDGVDPQQPRPRLEISTNHPIAVTIAVKCGDGRMMRHLFDD